MRKAQWGPHYERARSLVNFWHQVRFASPSTPIRERRANLDRPLSLRLRRRLRGAVRRAALALPGTGKSALRAEDRLFWSDTNAAGIDEQIGGLALDAVFSITPFLTDEEAALRACARRGIPLATAILSFDNLTTRPWIPLTFDAYLLWNRYNAEQLRRGYPAAVDRPITLVGSPQFDFYRDRSYVWSEGEWRKALGLPAGRPVILFGGGFFSCAPHEPLFLGQLDEAIESGEIPRDAVILFRRHPVDPIDRWKPVLDRARHVVHDDPWPLGKRVLGHTNLRRVDIEKLASTLFHSAVHVNVASTMAVDGAIFDRPQIGPAYDDSPGGKYHRSALECYRQEHYQPVVDSGGVDIAPAASGWWRAFAPPLRIPGAWPTAGAAWCVKSAPMMTAARRPAWWKPSAGSWAARTAGTGGRDESAPRRAAKARPGKRNESRDQEPATPLRHEGHWGEVSPRSSARAPLAVSSPEGVTFQSRVVAQPNGRLPIRRSRRFSLPKCRRCSLRAGWPRPHAPCRGTMAEVDCNVKA